MEKPQKIQSVSITLPSANELLSIFQESREKRLNDKNTSFKPSTALSGRSQRVNNVPVVSVSSRIRFGKFFRNCCCCKKKQSQVQPHDLTFESS